MNLWKIICFICGHSPIVERKGADSVCRCERCGQQVAYEDSVWKPSQAVFNKDLYKDKP